MGLVDHQVGAVAGLDLGKFGQGRAIAEHAVEAFDHHQHVAAALETAQAFVQIGRIVVAKAYDGGAAQAAAVVNAGVAVGVDEQNIVGPGEAGDGSQVGLVAGAEHHGRPAFEEAGDGRLEVLVGGVIAVGDTRAGGAGTFRRGRRPGRFDAVGIEGQAEVVVGPEQDNVAAPDDGFRGRAYLLHTHVEGIGAYLQQAVAGAGQGGKLVKQIHWRTHRWRDHL